MTVSYDNAVAFYDSTRGYPDGIPEQIRDVIIQYTQADTSTRFLELAIGTGLIGIPFIKAGYDYVGIDISANMMHQLRLKSDSDTFIPRLVQANITQTLPFPDNSFDVVNAVRVFHLLDNWKQSIEEAKRILRDEGYFIIAHNQPVLRNDESYLPPIVHTKLDSILEAFGIASDKGAWRLSNERLIEHLQKTGATTQIMDFVDYFIEPISVRLIVENHRQRIYSRYWHLPSSIHIKAMEKLQLWLDNDYPTPDDKVTQHMTFRAIIARWH